jgi:hypothetical protein
MDSTTNFSLRFLEGSESKAKAPDRLLEGQVLQRIATRTSLISLALGFSVLGMLIVVNRHRADLNDLPGGKFIVLVGGTGAILVGTVFLVAACLHWRFCAKRSAALSVSRVTGRLASEGPSQAGNRCLISRGISVEGGNNE